MVPSFTETAMWEFLNLETSMKGLYEHSGVVDFIRDILRHRDMGIFQNQDSVLVRKIQESITI